MPGVSKYADIFRRPFRDSLFVADEGAIPSTERVQRPVPCHIAHAGICATRDAARYDSLMAAASALHQHMREMSVPDGGAMRVHSADMAGEEVVTLYLMLASRRARDPVMTCFTLLERRGDDLQVAADEGGVVQILQASELAASLLKAAAVSVWVSMLVVDPLPHTCGIVRLQSSGAAKEIMASGRRAVAQPTLASQPKAKNALEQLGVDLEAAFNGITRAPPGRPRKRPHLIAQAPKVAAQQFEVSDGDGKAASSGAECGGDDDSSDAVVDVAFSAARRRPDVDGSKQGALSCSPARAHKHTHTQRHTLAATESMWLSLLQGTSRVVRTVVLEHRYCVRRPACDRVSRDQARREHVCVSDPWRPRTLSRHFRRTAACRAWRRGRCGCGRRPHRCRLGFPGGWRCWR